MAWPQYKCNKCGSVVSHKQTRPGRLPKVRIYVCKCGHEFAVLGK